MGTRPRRILRTRAEDKDFDFLPAEITRKTKTAVNIVKVAKATGVFDRLVFIILQCCGILQGEASDPPRLGERRNERWRGEEDQGKDTESSDHTFTFEGGESSLLDQMGTELWNRFSRKKLRKGRRKRRG
jgi:hypothetical protein